MLQIVIQKNIEIILIYLDNLDVLRDTEHLKDVVFPWRNWLHFAYFIGLWFVSQQPDTVTTFLWNFYFVVKSFSAIFCRGGVFHHTRALRGQKVQWEASLPFAFHHKSIMMPSCGEPLPTKCFRRVPRQALFLLNLPFSGFCGELLVNAAPIILLFQWFCNDFGEIYPSGSFPAPDDFTFSMVLHRLWWKPFLRQNANKQWLSVKYK